MRAFRLIALLQIFYFTALANSANCDYFGANIKPIKDAKTYNGVTDFSGGYNGDGIQDRLIFMYLPSKPQFAKEVNVVYMFDRKPKHPKEGSIGIAFVLSDKTKDKCKKYIIYNDGFFVSVGKGGMWSPTRLSADLIKKNSEGYLFWREQEVDVKTDAIEVISASGAGILIYWDGETFNAEWDKKFEN